MTQINPERPDRQIQDLFACISEDPKTGLQAICGVKIGNDQFQCVSSNIMVVERMAKCVKGADTSGLLFKIVRFSNVEVIETL